LIVSVEQRSPEHCRIELKAGFAHRILDADFPNAGCAEVQLIVAIVDQRYGFIGQ
jgi:hypothetical protein